MSKELVRQARESFERTLRHSCYTEIIRDDEHLHLLLEMAAEGRCGRILDIGTGTGYLAFPLAAAYPQALVCGIDITPGIVEENCRRARESGMTNLVFQEFDGITYPFAEESFDLVVSRYAFHHFPNPESAAEQIGRLLSSGGRLLLSDPLRAAEDASGVIDAFMKIKGDGHVCFYQIQELETLFAKAGLRKEKETVTQMTFPFPNRKAYEKLYEKCTPEELRIYNIGREGKTVWVRHMEVGSLLFVKE